MDSGDTNSVYSVWVEKVRLAMCKTKKQMITELTKHFPTRGRYYHTLWGKQLIHEYYDFKNRQGHSTSLRKSDAHPILDLYSKRKRSIM